MINVQQFGIYLAKVPFIDKETVYKVRPVLILDAEELSVAILKMTSNLSDEVYPLYVLDKWEIYGLRVPTAVRLDEKIYLKSGNIFSDKFLGMLDDDDIINIQNRINNL